MNRYIPFVVPALTAGFLLLVPASAFASVVYNAIPNPLAPNYPSQPFEAQQTNEFGDYVHLGGTDRQLSTIMVTMDNWALATSSENVAFCAASASNCDATGFNWPITVNVYASTTDANGVPNTLLATKTVTQHIPWRPAEDSIDCPTKDSPGYAYKYQSSPGAPDTNCYNGIAANITFDLSDLHVTLPNDVIVTFVYNTEGYGPKPVGVDGPYDSLNIAVPPNDPVTVGTDDSADKVFWNTSTVGWYTNKNCPGSTLCEDTNWTPYGTVALQINAASSAPAAPPAPTLVSPVNGTIWTTATLTGTSWNSVTDSVGGITYIYQSSNSTSTNPDGSFVTPAYTSGPLTATTIPTPGTPAGVYYWHVRAKDSAGNTSPWSTIWSFMVNNTVTPLAACPANTTANFIETVPVDSSSASPVSSATALVSGKQYLIVSTSTWQNSSLNVADTAYASVDNWASVMQGYNISPYFLGTGEFQLQVDGNFVNWGSYSPTHTYSYLYTGTGSPVNLGIFDGDSTTNPPTAIPGWYSDNSGSLAVSIYSCDPSTGTLTINKIANGGNGTFNFTSNIPGHTSFSITTTSGTGSVSFANVPVGTYQVTEVAQSGWTESDVGTCSSVGVESAGNDSCTITNTKNAKLGAIYGTNYEDVDGDGTLNDGDHHRLKGIIVNLTGPVATSTVTDNQGNYSFNSLPAGTYHISETVPAGWEETVPSSGSYTVILGAGQIVKDKNFGDFKFGTISGMKYGDVNANGRKDGNEVGLSGWTIQLKKNNKIVATTVTAADGTYSFSGLTAGVYTLAEVMKTGWVQTDHPSAVWILSGTNATHEYFGNHNGPVKPSHFGNEPAGGDDH